MLLNPAAVGIQRHSRAQETGDSDKQLNMDVNIYCIYSHTIYIYLYMMCNVPEQLQTIASPTYHVVTVK